MRPASRGELGRLPGTVPPAAAGATETVLRRCVDRRGVNPYEWLAELAGEAAPVLDLACGSAPMWPALAGRRYLGLDRSDAELSGAAARGAGPLVRADAAALPVADGAVRLVVCPMALMLLRPLPQVLAETARVLAPGGRLAAIVPADRPLSVRGAAVAAGLVAALGRRLSYPNDAALADLSGRFAAAGLRLAADQLQRFAYRLTSRGDADALLDSLYLPDLPPHPPPDHPRVPARARPCPRHHPGADPAHARGDPVPR